MQLLILQRGRSGGRPQQTVYPRRLPVNCDTHYVSLFLRSYIYYELWKDNPTSVTIVTLTVSDPCAAAPSTPLPYRYAIKTWCRSRFPANGSDSVSAKSELVHQKCAAASDPPKTAIDATLFPNIAICCRYLQVSTVPIFLGKGSGHTHPHILIL